MTTVGEGVDLAWLATGVRARKPSRCAVIALLGRPQSVGSCHPLLARSSFAIGASADAAITTVWLARVTKKYRYNPAVSSDPNWRAACATSAEASPTFVITWYIRASGIRRTGEG
jgi:hypothetical protein